MEISIRTSVESSRSHESHRDTEEQEEDPRPREQKKPRDILINSPEQDLWSNCTIMLLINELSFTINVCPVVFMRKAKNGNNSHNWIKTIRNWALANFLKWLKPVP